MTIRSGIRTVRDQYEISHTLKYDQRGRSMISTGMAGTPLHGYWPNSASVIFVKTLACGGPPRSRTHSRARARSGSVGGTPAIFIAK
jgi:hypothetical protein